MTINEDSARWIAERFQNAEPDGRYKQPRAVSRRELVGNLYEAIMAKRRAGYSFEGIASQLEELGAPMSVATLKSYLAEAGRTDRATVAPSPQDARRKKRAKCDANRRGDARRNAAPKEAEGSGERKQPTDARHQDGVAEGLMNMRLETGSSTDAVQIATTTIAPDASQHAVEDAQAKPPIDGPLDGKTKDVANAAREASVNGEAQSPDNANERNHEPAATSPVMKTGSFGFVPRNR